jgi:hypothetical protein
MTLVIARVIDGAVRILSDWKVTYADGRPSGPLEGALKAFPFGSGKLVVKARRTAGPFPDGDRC